MTVKSLVQKRVCVGNGAIGGGSTIISPSIGGDGGGGGSAIKVFSAIKVVNIRNIEKVAPVTRPILSYLP